MDHTIFSDEDSDENDSNSINASKRRHLGKAGRLFPLWYDGIEGEDSGSEKEESETELPAAGLGTKPTLRERVNRREKDGGLSFLSAEVTREESAWLQDDRPANVYRSFFRDIHTAGKKLAASLASAQLPQIEEEPELAESLAAISPNWGFRESLGEDDAYY